MKEGPKLNQYYHQNLVLGEFKKAHYFPGKTLEGTWRICCFSLRMTWKCTTLFSEGKNIIFVVSFLLELQPLWWKCWNNFLCKGMFVVKWTLNGWQNYCGCHISSTVSHPFVLLTLGFLSTAHSVTAGPLQPGQGRIRLHGGGGPPRVTWQESCTAVLTDGCLPTHFLLTLPPHPTAQNPHILLQQPPTPTLKSP